MLILKGWKIRKGDFSVPRVQLIMNANNIIGLNTSKNYWQFFIGLGYMTADFGLSGGNWAAFLFFITLAAGFAYFS